MSFKRTVPPPASPHPRFLAGFPEAPGRCGPGPGLCLVSGLCAHCCHTSPNGTRYRAHQSILPAARPPPLPRVSTSRLSSHCPRPLRRGLLLSPTSPRWNLCRPFNMWLGKGKMNVPSVFPIPIPSSTKKTLNEGRGASYQRRVCSENL